MQVRYHFLSLLLGFILKSYFVMTLAFYKYRWKSLGHVIPYILKKAPDFCLTPQCIFLPGKWSQSLKPHSYNKIENYMSKGQKMVPSYHFLISLVSLWVLRYCLDTWGSMWFHRNKIDSVVFLLFEISQWVTEKLITSDWAVCLCAVLVFISSVAKVSDIPPYQWLFPPL